MGKIKVYQKVCRPLTLVTDYKRHKQSEAYYEDDSNHRLHVKDGGGHHGHRLAIAMSI